MRRRIISVYICLLLAFLPVFAASREPVFAASQSGAAKDGDAAFVYEDYQEYNARLAAVAHASDLPDCGFDVVEEQIFPFTLTISDDPADDADRSDAPVESGAPDETDDADTVYLVPAFDREYRRLALFFTDREGAVFYRTDQLETNHRAAGQLAQPNEGILAVSFSDQNGDSLTDITLITSCVNETGAYAGRSYKIGDVLFQDGTSHTFYRDYRISDKINRFGMNKSVNEITAFVRDGSSAEFMYTATTLTELKTHGMVIVEEQCYTRTFEKQGRLTVVPGICRIANYDVFMIYLVNEQDYIVSSLQPMGEADNLYALRGIQCRDIDGDGLKDIVVLAKYSYEEADGQFAVVNDYSVYYQRTGGFSADTEIKKSCPCTDGDTMEQLVERLRAYWGWKSEQ